MKLTSIADKAKKNDGKEMVGDIDEDNAGR